MTKIYLTARQWQNTYRVSPDMDAPTLGVFFSTLADLFRKETDDALELWIVTTGTSTSLGTLKSIGRQPLITLIDVVRRWYGPGRVRFVRNIVAATNTTERTLTEQFAVAQAHEQFDKPQ